MMDDLVEFRSWREESVSQEKGSRLVHYYLEDFAGEEHLAVVGTERSLRHMLYVASEEFCRVYVQDEDGAGLLKWRSRREVVDWLACFLTRRDVGGPKLEKYPSPHAFGEMENSISNNHGVYRCRNMDKGHMSDITWSGASWTCGKQLRHYQEFCRNGTKIAINSFVLVLSEEENCYLAYLEDMYEDKKGLKKVKVRWFHRDQEFSCAIPPPSPHPNEVFITSYSQVISAECVDDIATVLTPEHYETCLASVSSSSGIRLCFRQFNKNKFKLFDLRTLRGYFNQIVLSLVGICAVPGNGEDVFDSDRMIKQFGSKRIRFVKGQQRFLSDHLDSKISGQIGCNTSMKPSYKKLKYDSPARNLQVKFVETHKWYTPPFKVGDRVELLCQDSGIRGCWFRCTVLQISNERLKVQYDDIQNVDGCGNLEEWISIHKLAAPDRLGMRHKGRFTVRPCPTCICLLDNVAVKNGMAVDAHWSDGWWEGVVVGADSCKVDMLRAYLPGEDILLSCELKNLRMSKDWTGDGWLDINDKPDILSSISSVSPTIKFSTCSSIQKGTDSGCSTMSGQEISATQVDFSGEDQLQDARITKSSVELVNCDEFKAAKQNMDDGNSDSDKEVSIGEDGTGS